MSNIAFMILRLCLFGCLSLGLSGCVNLKPKADVVKMYALGPVEPAEQPASTERPIFIVRPDLPAYLDGKHLQFRESDGEVGDLRHARWAEPLEEGVARTLAEYFKRSGKHEVSGFYPWPKRTRSTPELRVHFYKLGVLASGEIQMVADWELAESGRILASGAYNSESIQWMPRDAASFVKGLNEALQHLVLEIETAL